MLGISAELLLLGHTEGNWQKLPLGLNGVGILALLAHLFMPGRGSLRAFRCAMLICVVGGGVGVYQHYAGNAEFELEMVAELTGWPLIKEAMTGATPVLAPGALAQVGLVGLAYAWGARAWRGRG